MRLCDEVNKSPVKYRLGSFFGGLTEVAISQVEIGVLLALRHTCSD